MDQRHETKPAGKGVDALLPLTEVLWVGPGDALGDLARQDRVLLCLQKVKKQSKYSQVGRCVWVSYLWDCYLLVLLSLSHFNRRQVSYSRDQKVHQDVLTVGRAVHEHPQRLRQVVGEQVVVVPDEQKLCFIFLIKAEFDV